MAANRAMARRRATGCAPRSRCRRRPPTRWSGSMAAVPLPMVAPTAAAAARLQAELLDEDRIEVPVVTFPVPAACPPGEGAAQALVRISAQRYNRPEEYAWLGERLAARVHGARSTRSLLGRLRG